MTAETLQTDRRACDGMWRKHFPVTTQTLQTIYSVCVHTHRHTPRARWGSLLPTLSFRAVAFLMVGSLCQSRATPGLTPVSVTLGRLRCNFRQTRKSTYWNQYELSWGWHQYHQQHVTIGTEVNPRFFTLTRTHQSRAINNRQTVPSYPSLQPPGALQLIPERKSICSIFVSQVQQYYWTYPDSFLKTPCLKNQTYVVCKLYMCHRK